ncbi:MAG: hypothetical protein O7H41_00905 [Planctomycetota bacterium]|nr:hypothetical protein [Planctomycetota bacterium]
MPLWESHASSGSAGFASHNELLTVTMILLVIAAIAIPRILNMIKAGRETAALGSLREIAGGQAKFREEELGKDGKVDFAATLAELSQLGLIDEALGQAEAEGYRFSLAGGKDSWECSATPEEESSDIRNFIVCTDGVVRSSPPDSVADCGSDPVE